MNHLTENQLNEYFDDALDSESIQVVEAHLAVCKKCRCTLDELSNLSVMLKILPKEASRRDLTESVLAKLPQQKIHLAWKLVLATQAATVLGLSLLVITNLLPLVNPLNLFQVFEDMIPSIDLPAFPASSFILQLFSSPVLDLQVTTFNLGFLAVATLVLLVVGNAVLLKNGLKVKK